MSVTSTGYFVSNGNKWKSYHTVAVQQSSKSKESHAERQVYKVVSQKSPLILIVQDAFPCFDSCHDYFLKQSANSKVHIIIKVTADNTFDGGSYRQANLILNVNQTPFYIYYSGGFLHISAAAPNPPIHFPTHPSTQNIV